MHTQYPEENGPDSLIKDPRLIKEHLREGGLKSIVEKAHFLLALNRELQKILPPDYQQHCQVMNIEGTCLSVGVNNAALATRLRFQSHDLLKQLKAAMSGLEAITVLNVKIKN